MAAIFLVGLGLPPNKDKQPNLLLKKQTAQSKTNTRKIFMLNIAKAIQK
jgi:hypothetical protein